MVARCEQEREQRRPFRLCWGFSKCFWVFPSVFGFFRGFFRSTSCLGLCSRERQRVTDQNGTSLDLPSRNQREWRECCLQSSEFLELQIVSFRFSSLMLLATLKPCTYTLSTCRRTSRSSRLLSFCKRQVSFERIIPEDELSSQVSTPLGKKRKNQVKPTLGSRNTPSSTPTTLRMVRKWLKTDAATFGHFVAHFL